MLCLRWSRPRIKRVIIEGRFNLSPVWIVKSSHSSTRPLSVNRSSVNYERMYRLIQRTGMNDSRDIFARCSFSTMLARYYSNRILRIAKNNGARIKHEHFAIMINVLSRIRLALPKKSIVPRLILTGKLQCNERRLKLHGEIHWRWWFANCRVCVKKFHSFFSSIETSRYIFLSCFFTVVQGYSLIYRCTISLARICVRCYR